MITRETTKRLLAATVIAGVAAIIVSYSYFASYGLIDGPNIVITNPATVSKNGISYATASSSDVRISGVATRVNSLTLDGRSIVIDPQGNFSEMLLLSSGYNIETLSGQDKFGRKTSLVFALVYKE